MVLVQLPMRQSSVPNWTMAKSSPHARAPRGSAFGEIPFDPDAVSRPNHTCWHSSFDTSTLPCESGAMSPAPPRHRGGKTRASPRGSPRPRWPLRAPRQATPRQTVQHPPPGRASAQHSVRESDLEHPRGADRSVTSPARQIPRRHFRCALEHRVPPQDRLHI